jgi:CheY-like chemotaxis protein
MSYKVLIVDDSKLARMAVIKALNALKPGWTRVEAASADEAVKLMQQSSPDLALLDFNMPGRDGLDLAAELRQSNPRMPVAVISANHQQEIINRARAVGATFLAKPLTEDAIAGFLTLAEQELNKAKS